MESLAADHAEAIRLLYVATTRARDLLVVAAHTRHLAAHRLEGVVGTSCRDVLRGTPVAGDILRRSLKGRKQPALLDGA
mgnify:CR=1 FL=1